MYNTIERLLSAYYATVNGRRILNIYKNILR